MGRTILCLHCGRPILSRDTLAVGGRTLQPMHTSCYTAHSAALPWWRRPGWPANRWSSLLAFNAVLVALVVVLHLVTGPVPEGRRGGLVLILALANAWLLLARLVSYATVERHIPVGRTMVGR